MEEIIRQAIVNRVNSTHYDFKAFLNGDKADIDSWLGDAFPNVLREMGLENQYDHWRKQLFKD